MEDVIGGVFLEAGIPNLEYMTIFYTNSNRASNYVFYQIKSQHLLALPDLVLELIINLTECKFYQTQS